MGLVLFPLDFTRLDHDQERQEMTTLLFTGWVYNKTTATLSLPEARKQDFLTQADSGGALPGLGAR